MCIGVVHKCLINVGTNGIVLVENRAASRQEVRSLPQFSGIILTIDGVQPNRDLGTSMVDTTLKYRIKLPHVIKVPRPQIWFAVLWW